MELRGIELIKDYRKNPEKYLPMVNHTDEVPSRSEYGELNIGWNAGLLEPNRPYFAELWSVDHITVLTIYVSAKGIEEKSSEELVKWFQDIGYFSFGNDDSDSRSVTVKKFNYQHKDEFYSINITVGIDEEPALIDGGSVYPWSVLNELNKKTK